MKQSLVHPDTTRVIYASAFVFGDGPQKANFPIQSAQRLPRSQGENLFVVCVAEKDVGRTKAAKERYRKRRIRKLDSFFFSDTYDLSERRYTRAHWGMAALLFTKLRIQMPVSNSKHVYEGIEL